MNIAPSFPTNEKAPGGEPEAEPTAAGLVESTPGASRVQDVEFTVSLVANARSTSTTTVPLQRIAGWIREGRFKRDVEAIRAFCATKPDGWEEQVATLKRALPGFTPSGVFKRRASYALLRHSGLVVADLDKIDTMEMSRVRSILKADPHVALLFTSPTGTGLKALFRVPAEPRLHHASWKSVSDHVQKTCGVAIDPSGTDPARLCFVSFDPELHMAPNPAVLPVSFEHVAPSPKKSHPHPTLVLPMNQDVRRAVAESLLGTVEWISDQQGYCPCPGIALHKAGNSPRDCRVSVDGAPSVHCFHASCRQEVDRINASLRSLIGKAEAQAQSASFISKNGGVL